MERGFLMIASGILIALIRSKSWEGRTAVVDLVQSVRVRASIPLSSDMRSSAAVDAFIRV
jgi:hypothetical protein